MASLKLKQDEDFQTYGTYLASFMRLKSSSKWTFPSPSTSIKIYLDSALQETTQYAYSRTLLIGLPLSIGMLNPALSRLM